MLKSLAAATVSLFPLLARATEDAPVPPSAADADPTGMIVFVIVMAVMIGGYGFHIWRMERQRKQEEAPK